MSSRAACALVAVLGWLVGSGNGRSDSARCLVLVPVTFTTSVAVRSTACSENFRAFDDAVARTITQFDTDESPLALGIVFDASSSMRRTAPETPLAIPK